MSQLSFKIESNFSEVTNACSKLSDFCNENYLNTFASELQLVLTEALNNIIEHAYKKEDKNYIEIQLKYTDKKFTIILSDEGLQNSADLTRDLVFDPDDIDSIPERGMGLFIINKIMSKVEYRRTNNKNTFILIKHLS